jgi:peptide deformylase
MKIYKVYSPFLTEKTEKVKDFGKEFQSLIDRMIFTMRFSGGIGLAAPQVGEALKLFVAENDNKIYVIANPKIRYRSFEIESGLEGCLSLPLQREYVERSKSIGISGSDRYGNKIEIDADGLLARIFQHEIDHLNGILISDRRQIR